MRITECWHVNISQQQGYIYLLPREGYWELFGGFVAIEEKAEHDFCLQLRSSWKLNFGNGNGKTSFSFLLK